MARPRSEPPPETPKEPTPPLGVGSTVLMNVGVVEEKLRPVILVKHVVFGERDTDWAAIGHLLVLEADLPLPYGVRAWDEKHGVRVQVDPSNHGTGCGQWRER